MHTALAGWAGSSNEPLVAAAEQAAGHARLLHAARRGYAGVTASDSNVVAEMKALTASLCASA